MQRVTITIDDELMTELDRIIAARGYQNRSEAIRDLARAGIREAGQTLDAKRDCVAAVVYIYDHASRELPKRLTETFHDHHELSLSSLHVHLDHDSCMEVTVLKGKTGRRAALRGARDSGARGAPRPHRADAHGDAPARGFAAGKPAASSPARTRHIARLEAATVPLRGAPVICDFALMILFANEGKQSCAPA
jgi:CopG family transcriptional regulator, nickel-responsive regulator